MKLKYDLHLHSCLSPCADNDMSPINIVNMAKLAGLRLIALTDHNSTRNCPAFIKAAQEAGLLALPGMELTTSEEVHVLCLLPDIQAAEDFNSCIYKKLPDIKNNSRIFGEQYIIDENDTVTGEEEKLLISAAHIGLYEVSGLLDSYGGAAIPAHIDRGSFSLLSNLGLLDKAMGYNTVEVTRACDIIRLKEDHRELEGLGLLINSDAHRLMEIYDAEFELEAESLAGEAVIKALKNRCGLQLL